MAVAAQYSREKLRGRTPFRWRPPARRSLILTSVSTSPSRSASAAQPAPVGAAQNVDRNHAVDHIGAEQTHQIAGARDRRAIDGENNVAGQKAGVIGGAFGSTELITAPRVRERPSRSAIRRGRAMVPTPMQVGAPHPAMGDEFAEHEARCVGGDCEADALRPGDDCGVDADHLAVRSDQRSAGVAGVERGVGLDHVIDHAAVVRAQQRPRAEMTPAVTVESKPSGLPIAMAISPGRKRFESPSVAAGSVAASSIRTSARSGPDRRRARGLTGCGHRASSPPPGARPG